MKAKILIVALLACLALVLARSRFQPAEGIDFYQYWAVHRALAVSDPPLDHPYRDQAQYAGAVRTIVAESSDAALKQVDKHRKGLDLTGTPFLYSLLGFLLPRDYTLAYALFQVVQYASFLGAILLLARQYRVNWFESSILALLLASIYDPFVSDLRVGNTNSLQLLALVAMTCFACRLATESSSESRWIQRGLYVGGLCALTFFKPNLIPVTLLLAGHLVVRQGSRDWLPTVVAAGLCTTALVLLSCFYFGTWQVWGDWYNFVYRDHPDKFSGDGWASGNFAVVFLLGGRLGMGTAPAVALMGTLLGASALFALVVARPGHLPLVGGVWHSARRALSDPLLAGSAGVLALFALSPLIWQHYYTLSLLPSLWLLWGSHRWPAAGWLGGLSIALSSGIYFSLGSLLNQEIVVHCIYAVGWIPLWLGLLAAVVKRSESWPAAEEGFRLSESSSGLSDS